MQVPADLFTFIEEILNGKLNFLCSEPDRSLIAIILKAYFTRATIMKHSDFLIASPTELQIKGSTLFFQKSNFYAENQSTHFVYMIFFL